MYLFLRCSIYAVQMRLPSIVCWLGVFALITGSASAQTSAPKYSNEFLKIGVGARAAAMGGAVTATVDDATSGYWNPAGLTQLRLKNELALMHSEYFAGVAKYDFGAYATRIDSVSHLAFSVIRFAVDDIPNTLNFREGGSFNYNRITAFSVADLAVIASYARLLKGIPGLSVGASLKIINRTVGPFATAWGFGFDAGLQYRRKNLMVGVAYVDATSTFNAWSFNTEAFAEAFLATGNEVPQNSLELTLPSVRAGVAYRFFATKPFKLTAATDWVVHFDGPRNVLFNAGRSSYDPRVGLELAYKKWVSIRCGAMNFQRLPTADGQSRTLSIYPTAGLGVNIPLTGYLLQLDYALSNVGNVQNTLYSHVISVRFAFERIKL